MKLELEPQPQQSITRSRYTAIARRLALNYIVTLVALLLSIGVSVGMLMGIPFAESLVARCFAALSGFASVVAFGLLFRQAIQTMIIAFIVSIGRRGE